MNKHTAQSAQTTRMGTTITNASAAAPKPAGLRRDITCRAVTFNVDVDMAVCATDNESIVNADDVDAGALPLPPGNVSKSFAVEEAVLTAAVIIVLDELPLLSTEPVVDVIDDVDDDDVAVVVVVVVVSPDNTR
jgi:hypothetical protein